MPPREWQGNKKTGGEVKMKLLIEVAAKCIGAALMLLAVWIWWSYSYSNINPLVTLGAPLFDPMGMIGQFLNWLLVCFLGASGWYLLSLPKDTKK
jgi:hypothetical protein